MAFRSQILASGQSGASTIAITGAAATGIVATGSSQTNATQLSASLNFITTSTGSPGVLLPACEEGANVMIFNNSGVTINIYSRELSGVTFNNAVAGSTGITLTNGKTMELFAPAYNIWCSQAGATTA